MNIQFKSIVVTFLLASFVSTNAMIDPLSVKLTALKANLEVLQKKQRELKNKLGALKDILGTEDPLFLEDDETKSFLEQAWEWAEKKVAQEEAEMRRLEILIGLPQPEESGWVDEWITPYIQGVSTAWPRTSGSSYIIEGAGIPKDIYHTKQNNPDAPLEWMKTEHKPPLEISTAPLPPIPQPRRISFDFKISEKSLPNYSLSQFDDETRADLPEKTYKDFKIMFQPIFANSLGNITGAECLILSNYELYAYPNFLAYIHEFSIYDDYILDLHKKISTNQKIGKKSKFGDKTFKVYGFGSNTIPGFRYSGFHDLVKELADKVIEKKCQQARCLIDEVYVIKKLTEEYMHKLNTAKRTKDKELIARYEKRLKALNAGGARIDYSLKIKQHPTFIDPYAIVFDVCYGTALDQVLHEELCDTRVMMMALRHRYAYNALIEAYVHMIDRITAIAKIEQDAQKAFNLSAFAYDLVSIAAVGVGRGVISFLHPQTYLDAAVGAFELGVFLAKFEKPVDDIDITIYALMFPHDIDTLFHVSEAHQKRCQKDIQAVQEAFTQSLEKFNARPWQEKGMSTVQFVTELSMPWLAPRVLSLAQSFSGRKLVSDLAITLKAPQAEAYANGIATLEKVAATEGAGVAQVTTEVIKHNPSLIAQKEKSISQVVREVAKDITWTMPESGKIINGRLYTKHALERMAPDTIEVRAILSNRAIQKGHLPGTKPFNDYVNPRGIPPSVVEDAIKYGTKSIGRKPNTFDFTSTDVIVTVNDKTGAVVTVIPK